MTKIRIVREYDDHEPVVLGCIDSRLNDLQEDHRGHSVKVIQEEWVEFQATQPNCDSEFMDWLKTRGYIVIKDEFVDIVVD